MTAGAFSTFLYRFAAAGRNRTAENGDSTGFVAHSHRDNLSVSSAVPLRVAIL